MKKAILIHGWNTKAEYYDPNKATASNDHWFPWLSKQLLVNDIHAVAIEMPNGHTPNYGIWKKELERYEIDRDTILIGHSCGAGFLVRWLGENDTKVGKVFLVGPWLGSNEYDEASTFVHNFFDFNIDTKLSDKTQGLHVFYSEDDMESILKSVDKIKTSIDNITIHSFENKGHFTLTSLNGPVFPELIEEILHES